MSEVKVTLSVTDKVTKESQAILGKLGNTLKGVGEVGKSMVSSFDARAFAGVFRTFSKFTQYVGVLGAKLNELAPNAKQFTAAFGAQETAGLQKAAESFNRMGAAWDRFVGHVLSSSPKLNAAFDDVARRLNQVSNSDQLSASGKASARVLAAERSFAQIPESQREAPNVYYKRMVNLAKMELEAARAELEKVNAAYAHGSAILKERKADLAGIQSDSGYGDIKSLMESSSREMDAIWKNDMDSALEWSTTIAEGAEDAFFNIDEDAMHTAAVLERLRQEDLEDSEKVAREKVAALAEITKAALLEQAEYDEALSDALLSRHIDELQAASAKMREVIEESNRKAQEFAREAANIMTNNVMQFFDSLITGSENAGRAFTRMIAGMLSDFGRLQMSKALSKIFGDLFGVADSATTEGRASGGNVRGGMPIMVGERGPEMFVPSTSGNVITSGRSGSGGGIGSVVINVNGAQDPSRTAREVKSALSSLMANDPSARQMMRRAIA